MSQGVTASIVLYNHKVSEVAPLFQELARETALGEWTVVNNGGAEDACALAESLGARCLSPGRNLGFGGGHNLVLSQSSNIFKYHIVVNPDISFNRGVIDDLYRFMEDHHDVGLVMPKIQYPDGTDQGLRKLLPAPADLIARRFLGRMGNLLFRKRLESYELKHIDLTSACEVPCLSGCFMFLRSAVLREVGGFDERFFMYMEDVDLCRRIGAAAKCVYYPYAVVTHEYAQGSYRNHRLLRYHAQSALRYFSKWGWLFDPQGKALNRRAGKRVDSRRA